jgi:hypothetical protein
MKRIAASAAQQNHGISENYQGPVFQCQSSNDATEKKLLIEHWDRIFVLVFMSSVVPVIRISNTLRTELKPRS